MCQTATINSIRDVQNIGGLQVDAELLESTSEVDIIGGLNLGGEQSSLASSGSKCQGCGSAILERVLDLGNQPLCNDFLPSNQAPGPQTYFPLCLCYCPECSLVQLDYVIPTEVTFGDQYTYLTGSSPSLIKYFSELAARLVDRLDLRPGDTVVDIGCNDGTFLKSFRSLGINILGVEGTKKASELAVADGIPVINQFFGKGVAASVKERLPQGSRIRLITAMNVLAHTDNINEFLVDVSELIGPDTTFVSQSHWLLSLVRNFEFDTIYHEHLRYYTLGSLQRLFEGHGLYISDAEINNFYGGSVLSYATNQAGGQSPGLLSVMRQEDEIDAIQELKVMKQQLMSNKAQLISLLVELKTTGKRVIGLGAPMKASTLLNFYGITSDLVEYLAEVNPLKIGTDVPGARIPVVHEDIVFQEPPDYAILLSWNMADHLIPKYRSMGFEGKFILPVPKLEVIG